MITQKVSSCEIKNSYRYAVLSVLFFILLAFVFVASAQAKEQGAFIPNSFADLAEKAKHSVVNISTVSVVKAGRAPFSEQPPLNNEDMFQDFFDRYFQQQIPQEKRQSGLGSGFIIDAQGYILTNNHVVENAEEIKVKLSNGNEYGAKLVGRDPKTDLALVKIDTSDSLEPLTLGNSDDLRVGDWVVAIGNPFGLGDTVTSGIVSAKYRNIGMGAYDNFIQTDASINPGNSGGPLLNLQGKVVGINSAIFSRSGGNIGIGFAIPVNMVKDLLPQLKTGRIIRGWLGVAIQPVTPQLQDKFKLSGTNGALISDVTPGGPAEKSGIKRGDVIVFFNGKKVKTSGDLPYMVASTPVGESVAVQVIRDGKPQNIQVKIAELKEKPSAVAMEDNTPAFGFTVAEISPELADRYGLSETGELVITQVMSGSLAAEAGLRAGDIILEVDHQQPGSPSDFRERLHSYTKGATILLLIKRNAMTSYVTLGVQ